MKKNLLFALMAFVGLTAFASSNLGKDYFKIMEYTKAKAYFDSVLVKIPAESNYYLGEIALANGQTEDALAYFEKGIKANPNYILNTIGKGKALLKSDPVKAETILTGALKKKFKKDPEANIAVARAYFEAGLTDKMTQQLIKTRKVVKKNPDLYILEGDILKSQKEYGNAAGSYEQAIYFDENNFEAAIKLCQIYRISGPTSTEVAIERLSALTTVYPEYNIINRELARAYHIGGQYKFSIQSYVKYYGSQEYALEDLVNVAFAYYFLSLHEESMKYVQKGLENNQNHFLLNRVQMYNLTMIKNDSAKLEKAEKFFSLKGEFLDKDYSTYAVLLAEAGQYDKALGIYDTLLKAEDIKPEMYSDLGNLYSQMKSYVKSAEQYQKYIDLLSNEGSGKFAEAGDYYKLGIAWNKAAQALRNDTTQEGKALQKSYLIKTDTIFGVVCQLSPESHIGFLYRGNANFEMDPEAEAGIAKPHYEKALSIMNDRIAEGKATVESLKSAFSTIYSYMAFHYFKRDDKENVLSYSNKILEIDPKNKLAKSLIAVYEQEAAEVKK